MRVDDRLAYLAPRQRAAKRASRRAEIDPRFGDLIKADVPVYGRAVTDILL